MTETPRTASTICLLRDGAAGIEILMVRRTPVARFMGGAWVFPGGAVDETDGAAPAAAAVASNDDDLRPWRAAALRELIEETGIWIRESGVESATMRTTGKEVFAAVAVGDRLDGNALAYFANWITPAPLPVRFDTRFFATVVPDGVVPQIDGEELVDAAWVAPSSALQRSDDETWLVAFPTRRTLEWLERFDTTEELLLSIARSGPVPAIQPRLSVGDGKLEILVPGDPGFEDAAEGERDPDLLARAMEIAASGGDVPAEFESP